MRITKRKLRRLIREEVEHAMFPIGLELEVGGKSISAEVACCPQTRNQGLMYRAELGPNCGMLFAYPDSATRAFWMENTFIPLSIAFINEAGTILNIEDMVPLDRNNVQSNGDAMYALEMEQGWFNENHIGPGYGVTGLPGRSMI
tara:strand:- start:633 stop:1067 length:435 start_codon:yes stop_codon:yes gene_type:complete